MVQQQKSLSSVDPVWFRIRDEAEEMARREPMLAGLANDGVLRHDTLEAALTHRIAQKFASFDLGALAPAEVVAEGYARAPQLGVAARADILAVFERDPACHRYLQPLLYFKGFLALQAYRIAHWLWEEGRTDLALLMQMRSSELLSVDIHPNAKVGQGVMIDHAHAIVIGETAVVGDRVSLLHSVTLGGTGKEDGERHPKIGSGVMIGAGASVLGNITIGDCCRIAAGSVVLASVPPCKTVAGVPARVVGEAGCAEPSKAMDQLFAGPEG